MLFLCLVLNLSLYASHNVQAFLSDCVCSGISLVKSGSSHNYLYTQSNNNNVVQPYIAFQPTGTSQFKLYLA